MPVAITALVIVVAAVAVVVGLPFVVFRVGFLQICKRLFLHVPFLRAEPRSRSDEGEDCSFRTADGLTLRGTWFARDESAPQRGTVVFCHEFTGDRWAALSYVGPLRAGGFDLFAFDFRCHGESDAPADLVQLPWLCEEDLIDLNAALDYVASRPDADPRGVGLHGISRGGSAAWCAAARRDDVRCVVTDGAFATGRMVVSYMRRYMSIYTRLAPLLKPLPPLLALPLAYWTVRAAEVDTRRRFVWMDSLLPRVRKPALAIHGAADNYVPAEVALETAALLGGPCETWHVAGAKHNQGLDRAPGEYRRRVTDFFLKHLAGETIATPELEVETAVSGQPADARDESAVESDAAAATMAARSLRPC